MYKYGGQPFVRDYLSKHYGTDFDRTFGPKTGKAMMSSFAGSIIGIGEIILLPLDVLKIKRQTNPEAFRGRGVFRIVADEGFGLYRGWGWTAARNAPGSFAVSHTWLLPVGFTDQSFYCSSLVAPLSQKAISISWTITTRPRGCRTSWPPLQAHQLP